MKLKSEVTGGVVTTIYLVGVAFLVYLKRESLQTLELNAIGDFLAGVFGPIAFLWLVLGYIQQGRELKLSSEALRMQADELKGSVEQQTIMAAAATDQLKAQRAAYELQVWRHEQEISPNIEVSAFRTNGPHSGGETTSCIRLINRGHGVRSVSVTFTPALGSGGPINIGDLKAEDVTQDMSFKYQAPSERLNGYCLVKYLRADRKVIEDVFNYSVSANDGVITIIKAIPDPL